MVLNKLHKQGDTWYKVLKEIPEHNFKAKDGRIDMDFLAAWRDYVGADHVLRTQTTFLLCETVLDAVVID